jgi:hydrogenase 3 maturation protease
MPLLKTRLRKILRGAEGIALLAVGSHLRGDDAAGLLVAEELRKTWKGRRGSPRLAVFVGHTAPENLTGRIRKFNPTHVIVVDAADRGCRPGHVEVVDTDAAEAGASFSTHALPLGVLTGYLRDSIGCQVVVIGIQPATLEFGRAPSEPVVSAARAVSRTLAAVVRQDPNRAAKR